MLSHRTKLYLALIFLFLVLPLATSSAAGGTITGTVTDPKGAVVAGASVIALDSSNRPHAATTDQKGRYKIEGLAAGSYTLTVSAKGFSEARVEQLKVEDGKTLTADVHLEVAPVEVVTTVNVNEKAANNDTVYQQLRHNSDSPNAFGGSYATVSNLVLQRDAATFTLHSGELYFNASVEGRVTGAVFIGDGQLDLTPPTQVEKNSLALFTDKPALAEKFTQLVLRFSDGTFNDVKASQNAKMGTGGPQSARARDIFRDNQSLLRKKLHYNADLRTLEDIYAPQHTGFFIAFVSGQKYEKLVYQFDPQGIPEVVPEEVMLMSYGESDGGIWTAFHMGGVTGPGEGVSDHRLYDITHHEIDGMIRGTQIAATDRITFRVLSQHTRVLPFNLYRSLRVSQVQDEAGHDLNFIQEGKDEDADFGVILPQALEANKSYKITVQYKGGDALHDSGGGNFILIPRETWYPNNQATQFGDRAIFNMTFRYPKNKIFVGTGAPVEADTLDGDMKVSKWSSGQIELAVAGFNYGDFKKKEVFDKEAGYNIEFYANSEVPDELKAIQLAVERAESAGYHTETTLGSISTAKMADSALADAQNSTRVYNVFFGKLPYTRIAMTQQPAGFFGQAWPTLIFMPYTAFIDTTQRVQLFGVHGGTDTFWRYVGPHEIAHQWWGHIIGWNGYRDQWMSEGFAEFSASLYVQYIRKDTDKFIDFWEAHRKRIIESSPYTKGYKPYTVGPVTQGYRLSNAKTGGTYASLVYPKGAFILHMLRMMMYDPNKGGDARFQAMMTDFVKTHFNQDVSTEDFKQSVEKHMTPQMDLGGNGRMDWFFDQWVYGTEMPSYRFEYSINSNGGQATLTGRITQSGVSDNFRMRVPVYVDFGKGWMRLGSANIIGNKSVDLPSIPLPQAPKRAAICALDDVLALSIDNTKH
jgi:hypothetical protein